MADGGTNTHLKQQLQEWMKQIEAAIVLGALNSEKDLEEYVRVHSQQERDIVAQRFQGTIPPSLFEILGYQADTCEDHPLLTPVFVGTNKNKPCPDYILREYDKKDMATWDLKAVTEPLNNKDFAGQIQSYCSHPDRPTPLGILFNGFSLRVFINPDYSKLARYQLAMLKKKHGENWSLDFKTDPVIAVDKDDQDSNKQLIDSLILLSFSALSSKAVTLAVQLANSAVKKELDKAEKRRIVACIHSALADPSDEIIRVVAEAIPQWEGFDSPPSSERALRAWKQREILVTKSKTLVASINTSNTNAVSINSIVRQEVARICADVNKGWDCLTKASIKGLRFRYEAGNGYHPVPQTEGVPLNLHIGGLSTEDAKKVIKQLEAL